MNGLKDLVVCARDGLCGGCTRSRRGVGRGLGAGAAYFAEEEEDCWDAWPGEKPQAPPPIPKVIHVTTTDDADDDMLLGLDFVDSSVALPNDLALAEEPPIQPGYPFQRICGGPVIGAMAGRCHGPSSASSLSASTDTDHAQIFHAWTGAAACAAPKVTATMAYVFPVRKEHVQVGAAAMAAAVAVSDVDGSSYSSLDCGNYWLARSVRSSLKRSHLHPPTTPPTEASSVASF
jgi:hypothetical protein